MVLEAVGAVALEAVAAEALVMEESAVVAALL
jgi:hypothetical protein